LQELSLEERNMHDSEDTRLFRVRARHEDPHHSRIYREQSSEAAAIAYVEHLPFVAGLNEIGVIVRDLQTGHEHSYLLHLDPGDAPEII
jgi:hypothetical protein